MAMVPAVCDSCGGVFGSASVVAGTDSTVRFVNSKVGPCPICGGVGSIPDGLYGLQNDALRVIEASGTSREILQGLIDVLEGLRRGEASASQVIDQIEKEVPALAPTVREALSKPDPKWVALLIAIISLYLQATAAKPPSAEEVAEAIREKPAPTYFVTPPASETKAAAGPKARAKGKREPKTHGKDKCRKSRKRR